jgi:hypothetical protein
MKYIILLFLVSLINIFANAQPASANSEKYDVVVSFGSICCGTVSDDFLVDFIKQVNCKNKVTIQGWQLGGCGREGEFKILFLLNKLNASAKKKLITGLKKLVPEQNNKNKKAKANSGPISINFNFPTKQLENCSGQLTKWN